VTKSQGLFLILALVLPPGSAQTAIPTRLEVIVSVYDHAHVPSKTLAMAKQEVQRIFQQAGVEMVWVSCLPRPEKIELNSCSVVNATHVVLKILPHALTAQVHDRPDVIGNALLDENGTGYYAYAFLDRIQALEGRLGFALMGDVFAHELGHLLLGSNAHSVSGIMSAHWDGTELRLISQGSIGFLPSQAHRMKERMVSRQVDSPPVTRATPSLRRLSPINRTLRACATITSSDRSRDHRVLWRVMLYRPAIASKSSHLARCRRVVFNVDVRFSQLRGGTRQLARPVCKAGLSDSAFRLAEMLLIQCFLCGWWDTPAAR